MDTIKQILS